MGTVSIPFTTDASGNAALDSSVPVHGLLDRVAVANGDLAATADLTLTEKDTAAVLATFTNVAAAVSVRPRGGAVDTAGAAIAGSAVQIRVDGLLHLVVAQGGNAKSGTVRAYFSDDSAGSFASRTVTDHPAGTYTDPSTPDYLT